MCVAAGTPRARPYLAPVTVSRRRADVCIVSGTERAVLSISGAPVTWWWWRDCAAVIGWVLLEMGVTHLSGARSPLLVAAGTAATCALVWGLWRALETVGSSFRSGTRSRRGTFMGAVTTGQAPPGATGWVYGQDIDIRSGHVDASVYLLPAHPGGSAVQLRVLSPGVLRCETGQRGERGALVTAVTDIGRPSDG